MSAIDTTLVQPYLNFGGRCEEALEFYKKTLGAKVEFMMRFSETPQPPSGVPAGWEKKICHTTFHIGASTLMASDGCEANCEFKGFNLAINLPTVADVDRVFAALSEGGKVTMPPSKTFWSEKFGMVSDKFGMSWMVTVHPKQ